MRNPVKVLLLMIFLSAPAFLAAQPIQFEEASPVALDTPHRVVAGDFDEDGNADLAVASAFGQAVVLLLGDGQGGFESPVEFPAPFPLFIVTADFDEDGHLDVATTDFVGGTVSILIGDGSGAFEPASTFPSGSVPQSMAVSDYDEDGHLDLAVVNLGSDTLVTLIGDGTGAFAAPVTIANVDNPTFVVAEDFDQDGHRDLVVSSGIDSNLTFFYGNGEGGFPSISSYSLGVDDSIWFMVAEDVSGDGNLDIVIPCPNLDVVAVILGLSTGGFLPPMELGTGVQPKETLLEDFDGDSVHDLVAMNVGSNSVSVSVGDGLGGFQGRALFGVGNESLSMLTTDLDDDGQRDLVVASAIDGQLRVLLNRTQPPPDAPFLRGDALPDGSVGLEDATLLLLALFGDGELPCPDAGDVNDDGVLGLGDAIGLLGHLFGSGFPPPAAPGPDGCAADPTLDDDLPGCFYPDEVCP